MRNFQRALVAAGCRLKARLFSKVLDIDHAGDIAKAESFERRVMKKVIAIYRAEKFSPNSVEKTRP